MSYKTILMNEETYNRVSSAKRRLMERLGRKLSFGDLFNEVFGKSIDFLDIDEDLAAYIKRFCAMLQEKDYVLGVLLFGSVAKTSYNKYSDIDILAVVKDRRYAAPLMEHIHMAKKELDRQADRLAERHLPTFISPVILEKKDLDDFKPIYLDFLDYGIVLSEKDGVLTAFLNDMVKIKHRRVFSPYEVLKWQT